MAVLAAGMLNFVSAQNFGIEINFQNPFQNNNFFSNNGLSVRYFLDDNMAIRGTLTLGSVSNSTKNYDGDKLSNTVKTGTFSFGLQPGFEYHFVQSEKISVFAGAKIGFSLGKITSSTRYEDSSIDDRSSKISGFGYQAGIFTGIDYSITSNLYIGAEIGLDYNGISNGRGSSTTGSTTTKGPTSESTGTLGIAVTPALRLGWKF